LDLDGKKRPCFFALCWVEKQPEFGEAHLASGRFGKPEQFRLGEQRKDLCSLLSDSA